MKLLNFFHSFSFIFLTPLTLFNSDLKNHLIIIYLILINYHVYNNS